MIVSEARREANRRNALRSTGPTTEAGKDRSRRNALTHGLSAVEVGPPEDGPPFADPAEDWPAFLAGQVASIAAKLRRCERLDLLHRERIARRAETLWDDDRRLEAEFLGAGLAGDLSTVARSLRMSAQGCDWMIDRWSRLARAAEGPGTWTAEQTRLAFDLLGTPADFRAGSPGDPVDLEARASGPFDPAALARREVAALRRLRADLAPADALDRSEARTDPDSAADPALRRLRRHESDLHRRLRWCVAQLEQAKAPKMPTPPSPPPPQPLPPYPPARSPLAPPALGPGEVVDPAVIERLEALMDLVASEEARLDGTAPISARRPDPQAARDHRRRADRHRRNDPDSGEAGLHPIQGFEGGVMYSLSSSPVASQWRRA